MNSLADLVSLLLAVILISVIAVYTRGNGENNFIKIVILSIVLIIVFIALQFLN